MLYFLPKVLRTLMLFIMVSSKSNLTIRWFHFIVCSAIVRSRLKDSKNNPVIKRSQKKEEKYYWFHSLKVFHFVCNSTVRSRLKDCDCLMWEKVRTTKITTSKTKKNSENSVDDQNVESVHLFSIKVIRTSKIKNINYLWRITYGYQGLWGFRLGSIRLG
jgi:hypothetical protein